MPARVVAVTSLLLDVLQQIEVSQSTDPGSAEAALLGMMQEHRIQLGAIHAAAVKEMRALAPVVMIEA